MMKHHHKKNTIQAKMNLKLIVNPDDPALDALIASEIINERKKANINIVFSKDLKSPVNVQLEADGKVLCEDSADICRYLARTFDISLYGGGNSLEKTQVDTWMAFAQGSLIYNKKEYALVPLDKTLVTATWLVAKQLTLADIFIFTSLQMQNWDLQPDYNFYNVDRLYNQVLPLPAVTKYLPLVKEKQANDAKKKAAAAAAAAAATAAKLEARKQEGKFVDLPGAEMGKVVVRFPPEASGYLHIGHAKAALLNEYYAKTFKGTLIMRFDDTNPAKETYEFEKAILEDLKLLEIKPDKFTHTSDYFPLLLRCCEQLIRDEKAFVDDTPAEVMKDQREKRLPSKNRNNSAGRNLQLWGEMLEGTPRGQECCVRAKIDYESPNGCMRDPTIYRCKPEIHPRTHNIYKVYPTYDFACPIVDATENVTHTLRTTEYHDRDEQFYWFIDALRLRRPYIRAYSRLNMTHTVLSKRKLTWFVNEGIVDGWDDPRFPTVRGILRRGMTVEGLKQFIIAQGSSRSVVFMEWDKIWAINKKVIDPVAVRYTALNSDETVRVNIAGATEGFLTVQNHPKDKTIGTKQVKIRPMVIIELTDAKTLTEGTNATFINWGNIMIEKIHKTNDVITSIDARLNLEDKNYKNTVKLTWLAVKKIPSCLGVGFLTKGSTPCYAVYFNHIITKSVLDKDEDFRRHVAKETRQEVKMIGEFELQRVKQGEIIQLQRKGFFKCDVPYAPPTVFSSREQPLILFHIPDGHSTSSTTPEAPVANNDTTAKNNKDLGEIIKSIEAQGTKVRELKSVKSEKAVIDAEVKKLLSLKADYKQIAGSDWKPGVTAPVQRKESAKKSKSPVENKASTSAAGSSDSAMPSNDLLAVYNKVQEQGDKVRKLKGEKADKKVIDQEVKLLLSMKAEYKKASGKDWKPNEAPATSTAPGTSDSSESPAASIPTPNPSDIGGLLRMIADQAQTVEDQLKLIAILRERFVTGTGKDWLSAMEAEIIAAGGPTASARISRQIQDQGDKVRKLKLQQADKKTIDEAVKELLSLKAEYKAETGQDWKPSPDPPKLQATETTSAKPADSIADVIAQKIAKQGDKVRQLKAAKAEKGVIDEEVKILLKLKGDYKAETGEDWKPPADGKKNTSKSTEKPKKEKASKESKKEATKTGTRLGLEAAKYENLPEWFSQVITKGEMIEYSDISGCYILRPWSFSIWEVIKNFFDTEIKKLGVENSAFPMFVSKAALEKEKDHIADFAPEVAWVTKSGDSDLAEPIAIRPTSETVMYPFYAKWLKSHRDLPLKLNQWNSVVRWEFKHPQPFLRTREFLWQEGHSAFLTKAEAAEEVLVILELYAKIYEDLLCIPVVRGRKTEKEKFAGGDYTTTVEAYIAASGRAIQGATSHHLGQNFSKMFDILVETAEEGSEKSYVYQNSWGITTRTIGVMVMIHGDDKGLILPPKVASVQAIIIPCGITATTTSEQRQKLMDECKKLEQELKADGAIRVKGDYRDNYSPGWKFNHWELKGVPIRIEVGFRDLEKNEITLVRRDSNVKLSCTRPEAPNRVKEVLDWISKAMYTKAKNELDDHIKQTGDWTDFCKFLDQKNLLLSPYCGEISCEDAIKADSTRSDDEEPGAPSMGAKSLCIPFDQPKDSLDSLKCIHPKCSNKPKFFTLFGRSY